MTYLRKTHLAGEHCPSSAGSDQPTTAPLPEFVRLPFARRCAACSMRVPVSAIPGATDGVVACEFPVCAVHHICERNCTRNAAPGVEVALHQSKSRQTPMDSGEGGK